jgi:hypothetical protein
VLVIFQVLLERQGDKTIEIGSYVGAGDHYSGTAWFYDDEKLDPGLLGSKSPGVIMRAARCRSGSLIHITSAASHMNWATRLDCHMWLVSKATGGIR